MKVPFTDRRMELLLWGGDCIRIILILTLRAACGSSNTFQAASAGRSSPLVFRSPFSCLPPSVSKGLPKTHLFI